MFALVKRLASEFNYTHHNGRRLLWWMLGASAVTLLVWTITLAKIESDRAAVQDEVYRDTAAMMKSYSEQIARSIDYIDHLTLAVKYQWKKSGQEIHLEEQLREGFFPLATYFYVTLADDRGTLISTTLNRAAFKNIAHTDFFQYHRDNPDSALRINKPAQGNGNKGTVVRFTRRLEAPDGSFAGVLVLAVTPEFFATFRDEATLGLDDCLSVRYVDGTKLVAKLGDRVRHLDTLFHDTPHFEPAKGLIRMSASQFVDDRARIVAWQRAHDYPLVAAIALDESHLFADQKRHAKDYLRMALLVSLATFFVAFAGALFSSRLAWRKQQADEVKDTYRLATDGAQEGFLMIRALHGPGRSIVDFLVEDCNERGALLVDHARHTVLGARFSELYTQRQFQHLMDIFSRAMESGFYEDEFNMRSGGARSRWLYRRLVRAGNSAIAMTVRDITESKTYEEKLAAMANFDALTSLRNRHWLTNFLPGAIRHATSQGKLLALLFIDLDKFKNINDTAGHGVGDQLLAAVALRLKSLLRPGDEAVRIGGDEFTIILNGLDQEADIGQVSLRLLAALEEPFVLGDQAYRIGASIGASCYPRDGADAESLLRNADLAMYCAKEERRGGVHFYEPGMAERLKERAALEKELRTAVEKRQLVPYFQPRMDARTGHITGMEALVRWNHPERGLVPPNDFIPLAEATGIIDAIGELVLDRTALQIAAWHKQGLAVVPVSVNVSARQFAGRSMRAVIEDCIRRHGISPAWLEVELTESAMLGDSETVVQEIAAIAATGVKIHVDDFGTGYSSLSLLHRLDIDVLKIDRAFTAALGTNKGSEVLFQAIVSMAKALNLRVVAEGVETEEQLSIVRDLAVDEVQGYLVSPPLPADRVVSFLTVRRPTPAEELA